MTPIVLVPSTEEVPVVPGTALAPAHAEIPHIRFPLALAPDGDFAVVEQRSGDDTAQQIMALMRTPVGWSDEPDLAEMGLTEQAFYMGGADLAEIEAQIREYVPDFDGAVSEAPDAIDEALSIVNVRLSP